MSVHVISWVLRHSETKLGDRLVLLALADHAKEDGTASWPSVTTIGREARMDPRSARRSLRRLEAEGHILKRGVSRAGTVIWDVVMSPVSKPPGGQSVRGDKVSGGTNRPVGGDTESPEPSLRQPSVSTPSGVDTSSVIPSKNNIEARLCHLLASLILERDPKAKVRPTDKRWLTQMRLLIEKDGRPAEDVERVIRWCQVDPFWQGVVLSAPNLREKFDKLYQRMNAAKSPGTAGDVRETRREAKRLRTAEFLRDMDEEGR